MMYIKMDNVKYISEVDYLRVVEEKENYRSKYTATKQTKDVFKEKLNELKKELNEKNEEIINMKTNYRNSYKEFEKELEKRDEEIERYKTIIIDNGINYDNLNNMFDEREELKKENERLKERQKFLECNNNELFSLTEYISKYIKDNTRRADVIVAIEEMERLKNLYESEKQYEDWCELKYWYNDEKTNETKMYRQHMNYEDACELIGMDSDNWNEFNVVKYKKEVE